MQNGERDRYPTPTKDRRSRKKWSYVQVAHGGLAGCFKTAPQESDLYSS
jgi:hypothetical protein